MNIGIIGFGVVGSALKNEFEKKHKIFCYDNDSIKQHELRDLGIFYTIKEMMVYCKIIFVCVPTPTVNDKFSGLIVQEILDLLQKIKVYHNLKVKEYPIIAVKSTVLPHIMRLWLEMFKDLRLTCNPEFLTENNYSKEMSKPDKIVIGLTNQADRKIFSNLYGKYDSKIFWTDPVTACLIKYLNNVFLVVKVAFAMFGKRMSEYYKANPQTVMEAIGSDKRIGYSHLDPSFGKIALSSHCLPKDLNALIHYFNISGKNKKIEPEFVDFLYIIRSLGVET